MAAPWQGLPVRLERAPHRGAAFALSNASKRARIRSIGSSSRGSLLIFRPSPRRRSGRRKVKGNMDIELAVDAMEIAGSIDHMVLFSGDGDFRSLVEAVQRRGVRVTVVSTISTQPPMVAAELRRQADIFLDIVELQPKIGRDP